MAVFFVSYVKIQNEQIAYRLIDQATLKVRVYDKNTIIQGDKNGVRVSNLFIEDNQIKVRGNNYPTSELNGRLAMGIPVTIVAKDTKNKLYKISNCFGITSVCHSNNIENLCKNKLVTNAVLVSSSFVRILPNIDIPEETLDVEYQLHTNGGKVGCWGIVNTKGEASEIKFFDYDNQKMVSKTSATKDLDLGIDYVHCPEGFIRFSSYITPIPKELIFTRKQLKDTYFGVLVCRDKNSKDTDLNFIVTYISSNVYGDAIERVSIKEVIGNVLEGKSLYWAKYGKNKDGDIMIKTLIDTVVIDKLSVDKYWNDYKKGKESSNITENISTLINDYEFDIDSNGELRRVKYIGRLNLDLPKGIKSIGYRAFSKVEVKGNDNKGIKYIDSMTIPETVLKVESPHKALLSNLYINRLVIKSQAIAQDLEVIRGLHPNHLEIYCNNWRDINGWDIVSKAESIQVNGKTMQEINNIELTKKYYNGYIKSYGINRDLNLMHRCYEKVESTGIDIVSNDHRNKGYSKIFKGNKSRISESNFHLDLGLYTSLFGNCTNIVEVNNFFTRSDAMISMINIMVDKFNAVGIKDDYVDIKVADFKAEVKKCRDRVQNLLANENKNSSTQIITSKKYKQIIVETRYPITGGQEESKPAYARIICVDKPCVMLRYKLANGKEINFVFNSLTKGNFKNNMYECIDYENGNFPHEKVKKYISQLTKRIQSSGYVPIINGIHEWTRTISYIINDELMGTNLKDAYNINYFQVLPRDWKG